MGGPFDSFKTNTDVPIVGKELEVLAIRPVVVAKCTCGTKDAQVFTILDPSEVVRCLGCGKHYTLRQLQFVKDDAGNIEGSCTVSRVLVRHQPS